MSEDSSKFKAIFPSGKNKAIGENKEFRVLEESGSCYIVQYKDEIYNIEVDSFSEADKAYKLLVNDQPVSLQLRNELDQLIEKMGLNKKGSDNMSQLKAPMPGLVLKIHVDAGAEIDEGDALITLEAMKMENIIKAKGSGVVKSIEVATQDKVEKSQILIEFE